MTIIWDSFKAYICRILIKCKAVRNKNRGLVKKELMKEIADLEERNKQEVLDTRFLKNQFLYQPENLINASTLVQDIISAKQLISE